VRKLAYGFSVRSSMANPAFAAKRTARSIRSGFPDSARARADDAHGFSAAGLGGRCD